MRRASDHFARFDSIRYPIGYGNVGEVAPVEVLRISPQDATAIVDETAPGERRRKLAGTRLGHFGGFFERGCAGAVVAVALGEKALTTRRGRERRSSSPPGPGPIARAGLS